MQHCIEGIVTLTFSRVAISVELNKGREGMSTYRVISADSHVVETEDLWRTYLDKRFQDKAPRLVHQPTRDAWAIEGLGAPVSAGHNRAGTRPEDLGKTFRFMEGLTGGWDAESRLKDVARDGIDGEVLYPSSSMHIFRHPDLDFQWACFRAYNRWLSEFCASHPDKLKGLALISLQDIETAVAELGKAKKLGLAGAVIALYPDKDKPYSGPMYDPFWAACQDLEMPLSLHILTGRGVDLHDLMVDYSIAPTIVQRTLAVLVFSGVFERFPGLKVVSAENDISWAADFLQRMDHVYQLHRHYVPTKLTSGKLPSELFKEHVYCTFQRDLAGAKLAGTIGAGNMLWASDYPHVDSTWPRSQQVIAEHTSFLTEQEGRMVFCENAARLYRFTEE